jgi:multidrug resistance efflux pump
VILALAGVVTSLGFYWPFGNGRTELRLPGVVEIQEVRLGPRVAGRVSEVRVLEGELVKPGQVLVSLDVPELEPQREQARARLKQAEADLEKARNGPREEEKDAALGAMEAARARLKRLKAGNREEEVRQARSELDAAQADVKLATEEFHRAARLIRTSSTARADYDSARAALDRHRGRVAMAKARFEMMKAGYRDEEIEEGEAELKRTLANYRLLKAGTRSEDIEAAEARVHEAQARLREIEVQIKETTVVAAEPAVVEVVAVRKGDLVVANQPVVRVLRAADLWVKVYVPETELGKVRLGQAVEVTIDTYRDRRFQGKVVQIGSESEFTPRNVQSVDDRRHQVFGVRIRMDDPQGVFKAGMAAEVVIPVGD